jgi:hypothetical protein
LELEEFNGREIPTYAILSHTWGPQEVSFSDYTSNREAAKSKDGYEKILFTCAQAYEDNIPYAWVDTCCIDKSSSAELSESINSMYKWYENAEVCYVYLVDVSEANFNIEFPKSRWFSRGWTLQELIAPDCVDFYDQDGCGIGSKDEHLELISKITQIDIEALMPWEELKKEDREIGLGTFCVAQRMSWASNRETTRVEDMSYCLLGIFNVNMPLLYGEGERAFIRLQEEIIRSYDDDSILAWGLDTEIDHPFIPEEVEDSICEYTATREIGFLARSPKAFENCQSLRLAGCSASPFFMSNLGLQIELPLVPVYTTKLECKWDVLGQIRGWIGILSCMADDPYKLPGIALSLVEATSTPPFPVGRAGFIRSHDALQKHTFLVGVRAIAQATYTKITISQHHDSQAERERLIGFGHTIINTSQALRDVGYHISTTLGWNMDGGFRYKDDIGWDPAQNIFTRSGDWFVDDLVRVCFSLRPGGTGHEFSVFICKKNAIVRQGSSFTEAEHHTFYNFLRYNSQEDNLNDPVITRIEEGVRKRYRIVVTTKINVVFRLCIFVVSVDIVPCTRRRAKEPVGAACQPPRCQTSGSGKRRAVYDNV